MRETHAPLRIGISACLLGSEVRYDGGHKRDRALLAHLGGLVTWVSVCPEVESGMSVPRPPIRFERRGDDVVLVDFTASGADVGAPLRAFAARRVDELLSAGLDGFVLKSRSPSCGLGDVPVHGRGGAEAGTGDGVFAAALRAAAPDLPLATEAALATKAARDAFLARCRAFRRGYSRSKGE